jgi:ABC-type nitrate/sulfonate/bicarbonate transport system substrate-binding protein
LAEIGREPFLWKCPTQRIFRLLLLVSFFCYGQPLYAADKIRIGVTNPNMTFLSARIAVTHGFFKQEGLEAEVIQMRVPVMITAISTGDLDYTMVFGSVVRAALRGLPVKVVASLFWTAPPTLFYPEQNSNQSKS